MVNFSTDDYSNKDNRLTQTSRRIAVKNGNTWRIYDMDKKKIVDAGDINNQTIPCYFLLPTTKLKEGNLITDGSEFFFVKQIETCDSPMQIISVKTDSVTLITPIKNFMGFECYLRVIILDDQMSNVDRIDIDNWLFFRSYFNNLM